MKIKFLLIVAFAIFAIGFASACVCGNGVIDQLTEECDDGNLVNNDGCSANCKIEYCGDGIKQSNEQCDDGNNYEGDGCSSECTIEGECDIELTKSADKSSAEVGDIVKFTLHYKNIGNEVCTGTGVKIQDTLNWNLEYQGSFNKNLLNDADGMGLDFAWHDIPGFNATTNTLIWNAHTVSPGEEGTITFDVKIIEPEQCGDFEISNYFKAWSDQESWKNSNTINIFVNNDCPPEPYCGDGIINQASEECDDGNNEDGDGCSAQCTTEEQHYCGDGNLDSGEECDDGLNNGIICTPAYGGSCTYCSNICDEITLTNGYCGDGVLQAQYEECDDGNNENGDGCSAECQEEQQFCQEDISIRYSYANSYGTGIAIGYENASTWFSQKPVHLNKGIYKVKYFIDNNIANTTNNAHILVKLNNSVLFDYNYIISKYHSKTFTLNTTNLQCNALYKITVNIDSQHNIFCTPDDISDNYAERTFIIDCIPEGYCGDGIIQSGEECDDGNNENGDGCNAECEEEEEQPRCGDGIINQITETCDDGNLINNDGCSANCKIEYCGDGIKQFSEQCDDGNLLNGDGCNSQCRIEFCGNGIKDSGEECDDGNYNNYDSCRNNCKLPYCGDGIKDSKEQCDDGNLINNDGCSVNCRLTIPGCPPGTICGNITTEEFEPIVWQCGYRIMTDENVQPWRFSNEGDLLYERAGNYMFEGEKLKVDVVIFDKNKIDDVVVDLILDSYPEYITSVDEAEYSVNCVEVCEQSVNFDKCNAKLGEEKITEYDENTMQAYECSITILDSEHMYGEYWLTVFADDKEKSGMYDEKTPLWLNPIISLDVEGSLIFDEIRPGTSSYRQVTVTNNAEGGVALDMFITGERWYPSGGKLGRCMNVDDKGVATGEYVNYIPLGAFRYYAENGAFTTRLDEENDNQDYYNKVTRDSDSEGYVNIHPQLNAGFEERMFDEAEIIQAGGAVVNGEGYRANVLNPGNKIALTFRLNYPEPCYGEYDAGTFYLWGEAI